MKKWLVLLLGLLVVITCIVYLLLPSQPRVSHSSVVGANASSIYRSLTSRQQIEKWLSTSSTQQEQVSGNAVTQGNYTFRFLPNAFNIVEVIIEGAEAKTSSFITILPVGEDSSLITWKTEWPADNNPVNRIQHSLQASGVKKEQRTLWRKLIDFIGKEENIYGLAIQQTTVTDTLLLTSKRNSPSYPTPEMYYGMIGEIRDFMMDKGISETNYPMLHIAKTANGFEAMVAVPVNKSITGNKNIVLKKMVKGNLLATEVRGGPKTIEEGFQQLEYYMLEKRLLSPAIPFQSLITDRMQEPDTTRWITKLNYPVL